MGPATSIKHTCYRCVVHEVQSPFREQGHEDAPALESLETTFSEDGSDVCFSSGYSAREIAEKHALEKGGQVYVNNISRNIRRRDLSASVAYAVSPSPVYTLRGPDKLHDKVYRAYWPPLHNPAGS